MLHAKGWAFAAAVSLASATTALGDDAAPVAPDNPAIHVSAGDSWTYDLRDQVTGDAQGTIGFEVTKLSDAGIETRETVTKKATGMKSSATEIFDARWRMKDNGRVVFRPYLANTGVPDDLKVGKTWSFKYQVVRKGAGAPLDFAGEGKVESFERLKLPSGASFDAFRIDVKFASVANPNKHKHETHTVMWFAPSANRLVKRTDEVRDNGKLMDSSEQTLREYKPASKT
jgi:hypothetical protein